VREAVHEMAMVQQSSKKITDIISLIDGIAFQTNILALNAAVEAARAGAQGSNKVQSIASIMTEVTQSSGDLHLLVEQISSGSRLQSQHMSEMAASVAALNSGNDNNVHIVSGLRLAMSELRNMAQSLTDKVDTFKTVEP
jgi:methyl-accepting chemotaxis protein